jgi:Putative Actinobacterial Holin-X, holin superfamily III
MENSFASLLKDLIAEIGQLFRQELRLARAETGEKLAQAQNGIIAIVVGLLLAFSSLLILLQAVVIALSAIMPAWAASVVVAAAVAIIAFILIRGGQSNLKLTNLAPTRTLDAMRRDRDMVMEKVDVTTKRVA